MSVAFVQNASGAVVAGANLAATLGAAPTQNNLLTGQAFTKSDTGISNPSGWSTAIDVVNATNADTLRIAYKVAGAGESATITFVNGTADNAALGLNEFSGTATSSPLDKTASTGITTAVTSLSSGTTATTTQADEVSVAAFGFRGVPTTPTLDSSFIKTNVVDSTGAAPADLVDGYRLEAATAAISTNAAWAGALDVMGAIATFKGLAAASATNDRPASIAHRTGIGPQRRMAFAQRYPDSPVTPVELTQSPAAPFRPGRGPGMGPMLLRRNLVWPSATYSPDVTLALTGVQAAGAVGTLGVQHDQALTGNAATGAVGTLTPGTTLALTGVAGTGSVGTLAPSTDVAMAGVAGTGSVGTLAPSTTVTLTGNAATVTIGTLTPSVSGADVTVALTGVSAIASVGDLSPSGADVPAVPVQPSVGGGGGIASTPIQDRYWRQIEQRYKKKKKQAEKKSERAVELVEEIARRGDDLAEALQELKAELAEEHIRQSKVYVELLKLKLELAEADEEEEEAVTLLASEEFRL